MKKPLVLLLLMFCLRLVAAGQDSLVEVKGIPSKEVYDLLIDSKGYLWIAHELGITRYDGARFIHFSHPRQASLSMSGMLEDRNGRIWFHNFSGQIFFIDKGRMELLERYDHTKEQVFPKMVILQDEMIATTYNGLFIYNTSTGKHRLIKLSDRKPVSAFYLSAFRDKVLISEANTDFETERFYLYEPGKSIKRLPSGMSLPKETLINVSIFPQTLKDTFFLIHNSSGTVHKGYIKNDSVLHGGFIQLGNYINTVTADKQWAWVNSRAKSLRSDYKDSISGYNISDRVTDRHGNIWVSSLKKGLLVKRQQPAWEKVAMEGIGGGRFVQKLLRQDSFFIYGTNDGEIRVQSLGASKDTWHIRPPQNTGGVELLKTIHEDNILVNLAGPGTLVIDVKNRKVTPFKIIVNAKDADYHGGRLFAASSVALFALGFPDAGNTAHLSPVLKPETFPGFRQQRIGSYEVFIRDNRCHAVRYDRKGHTLYASFKEGLYTFSGQGYKQVTYQNVPVFSPALEYAGGKMFIATYAKGLLVKEGTQMKNITVNDGLLSNTIIRMKAIGNHLWLFLNVGIQVMDVTTLQIRSDLEFPNIAGINAFDVAEWNGSAYITTEEGIYKVPVNQRTVATVPDSYLNYVLINSTDTVTTQGVTLSHARNNIEFYLSAPWFDVTKKLHYQYRLRGNEVDEQWHNTDDLGSVIRYASLAPGDYVFESYAVDNNGNRERTGVRFAFTIRKPWWRQWWFLLSVVFVFLASTYALYRFRLYQLLRVERMRRSISSDLHDDIGSTLSSINIYTELAKRTEQNTEFLHLIQGNATDIITKLDDLVWGINPKNDTGEQLVSRMKLFAESLLSAAHIQFNLEYNPELTGMKLDLKQKQNIYLLFKEAVNNVAKHSGATRCTVRLKVSGRRLDMEITDNGRGFDPAGVNTNRNGLKNMRDRAAEMKGNASVYSEPGAGTRIHVQALL